MALGKRGIELSVNFIVMLIIAIVVFSLGLSVTFKLIGKVQKVSDAVDASTKADIERLLVRSNQRTVLPFNNKAVRIGEDATFNLGISYNGGETTERFGIKVACKSFVALGGSSAACPSAANAPSVQFISELAIKNNAFDVVKLLFVTKGSGFRASPGTYYYVVQVGQCNQDGTGVTNSCAPFTSSTNIQGTGVPPWGAYPPSHQITLTVK